MRHTLELKSIAALKNCMRRSGRRSGMPFVRARYLKQMQAWGYGAQEAGQAWLDVCEVADLEMAAV